VLNYGTELNIDAFVWVEEDAALMNLGRGQNPSVRRCRLEQPLYTHFCAVDVVLVLVMNTRRGAAASEIPLIPADKDFLAICCTKPRESPPQGQGQGRKTCVQQCVCPSATAEMSIG